MIAVSIEVEQLEHVPSIQYPVQFKGHTTVQALLDSGSKVNAIILQLIRPYWGYVFAPPMSELRRLIG